MKKIISVSMIISIITLLVGCANSNTGSTGTVTIDNYGEEIIFAPSEKDWCGENCIIYPENGAMYVRVPESGSDIFYPEGTDRNLEEASEEIKNIIKNYEEWTEYKDTENGFQISYPAGWRIVKENTFVGFGPKEIHEDVAWTVSFYEKDKYDIEKIISDIGDQFNPDRNETRETISLKDVQSNIIEATLVTVTISKHQDWYSQTVIVQGENTIYAIGNGASKDEKFKYFYESFQQL